MKWTGSYNGRATSSSNKSERMSAAEIASEASSMKQERVVRANGSVFYASIPSLVILLTMRRWWPRGRRRQPRGPAHRFGEGPKEAVGGKQVGILQGEVLSQG